MNLPAFWPDVLRTVVFGAYALLSGQTVAVLRYYLRVYRTARQVGHRAAVPVHLWLITLVCWVLATECAVFTYSRVGRPLVAWGAVSLAAFSLAVVTMFLLLRYERRKVPNPGLLLVHLQDRNDRHSAPTVEHHHGDPGFLRKVG